MATRPLVFCQDKKEAEERKRLEQQAKTDELLKDQRGARGIFFQGILAVTEIRPFLAFVRR